MIPSDKFIRVVSGFYYGGKVVVNRFYSGMPSIAVPGQSGTIIPLEVVPATDGSGTYVLVVSVQDASIDVGTVDVALTYNLNPPVLTNGETTGFQSDINGNLKVTLAQTTGSNTIGIVNQGLGGASAWKVDPSEVTSPVAVESMPSLPAGTNTIGGVYAAPTSSSSFAITPGSSPSLESSRILKASAGNLYSLYVVTTSVGGYLMTFNATSVPADGAVTPVDCIPVPASSIVSISADGSAPDSYSAGIVVVFSTTGPFVKTSSPTAFFRWSVK